MKVKRALLSIFIIFHFINFLIALYMSARTLQPVWTNSCSCAILNIWWLAIAVYFITSVVVGVYILGFLFKLNRGVWAFECSIAMLLSAIAFVYITIYYLRLLQSKECKCISQQYIRDLQFLAKIRYAALSILFTFGILFIVIGIAVLANKR
jgi:hypothetical protein